MNVRTVQVNTVNGMKTKSSVIAVLWFSFSQSHICNDTSMVGSVAGLKFPGLGLSHSYFAEDKNESDGDE